MSEYLPSESTLRRRASAKGLVLQKVRPRSNPAHRPGTYQLVDAARNYLVADDLDLEDVLAEINAR